MTSPFFSVDSLGKFRNLERRLDSIGVSLKRFKKLDVEQLQEAEKKLTSLIERRKRTMPAFEALKDDAIVRGLLTVGAIRELREWKAERDDGVKLVEGMTYWVVKTEDNRLVGKRCHYLGESEARWAHVDADVRVMKALELLRHGDDEDFRKIYFEMADGAGVESVNGFVRAHITESSDQALALIEGYCNSRWNGPWPWQVPAPRKLKMLIKENIVTSLKKFRAEFEADDQLIFEGELEKSEIITDLIGWNGEIDSMIEKFGKRTGELIASVREKIRTEFGDHGLDGIDSMIDKIKVTVDTLTDAKTEVESTIQSLLGNAPQDDFDAPDGAPPVSADGLGGDMGDEPPAFDDGADDGLGDDLSLDDEGDLGDDAFADGNLDDLNLDDIDGERPKKDL